MNPFVSRRFCVAAAICFLIASGSARSEELKLVSFDRDVQPILQTHCTECHGAGEAESGLRVDARSWLLRGGDSGESALVPGDAANSLLIHLVKGDDTDRRMPPDDPSLSGEQISILSRWIDQGAHWSAEVASTDADPAPSVSSSDHWSLQPLERPAVPQVAGCDHPIDAFIGRELARKGLQFSSRADPQVLLRRASLVLTGLPPQAGEKAPKNPISYRKLVDRLLASPRYGERWAQHWLDVIRWAETVGFETNRERKQAWPYRDWVIAALNSDKPYDQFVREQIAGDQTEQDAALGFLVAGPANLPGQIGRDEEAMRQARQDELDEVIQTVSQSVMGMTVGCARCHNHKFDPILQKDYYSMQAVFAGLSYGDRRLRGEENDRLSAQVPALKQQIRSLVEQAESARVRYRLDPPLPSFPSQRFDAIFADAIRMEIFATNKGAPASLYELQGWTRETDNGATRNVALAANGGRSSASSFALANQTRHHENLIDGNVDRRQAFPWVAAESGPAWVQVNFDKPAWIDRVAWDTSGSIPVDLRVRVHDIKSGQWNTVASSRNRMLRTDDERDADEIVISGLLDVEIEECATINRRIRQTQASLVRVSAGPRVFAATFVDAPEPTFQLRRGDPMQRIAKVVPSTPAVLGSLGLNSGAPDRTRRLALADHLTAADHPLTARVIVNRIWQHHFGVGIVDTPSDFGKMGSPPSHPDLLDWLATELVQHNWSIKHIHRQILNSRTFQQSSTPREEAMQIDADSRQVWRFPPRRIEAESIRDSILQASGNLNLEMGGTGFDFFRQRGGLADYKPIEVFDHKGWRRMIYAHKIRMQSVDVFGAFDCPDAGQMKPRRTQSITPLQSLSLLNSPFVNRQADFFASRVRREVGTQIPDQIDRAFEIAFGRTATETERRKLIPLVRNEGLSQLGRMLMNTSEFLYLH
tara:strand:+ start:78988 stop:81783 length:2796 start_codon:yes stop_codon:yes gene_type:complete